MREFPFRKPNGASERGRRRLGLSTFTQWAIVLILFGLCGLMVVHLDRLRQRVEKGLPTFIDGDTIELSGVRMRLRGIDAFERGQPCEKGGAAFDCGARATAALKAFAAGHAVTCDGRGLDRYGRLLAVCTAAGRDLNAAMVDAGWAVAYGGYETEEARARLSGAGAWAGSFERPSQWRSTRGGLAETPHDMLQRLIGLLRALLSDTEGPAS
jgi:endonuclease YncB( thermonuclease family)